MLGSRCHRRALLVVALGGALVACDDGNTTSGAAPTTAAAVDQSPESFVTLLRNSNIDFEPVGSPAELASIADLTVVGSIETVEEGRTFAATPDSGPVWFTVVLVVRVDQVLAGDATAVVNDTIYVEINRTELETAETYRSAIPPGQPVALFLEERTDVNQGGPVTDAQNIPADARLFSPYPEGLILESELTGQLLGGAVELDDLGADWEGIDTLNALTELVGVTPGDPNVGDVPDTATP